MWYMLSVKMRVWYAYVPWAFFSSVPFCLNQILSETEGKYPVACFGYRTRLFASVSIVCTAEAPGTSVVPSMWSFVLKYLESCLCEIEKGKELIVYQILFAFKVNGEKFSSFSLSGNTSCHFIFKTLQLLKQTDVVYTFFISLCWGEHLSSSR